MRGVRGRQDLLEGRGGEEREGKGREGEGVVTSRRVGPGPTVPTHTTFHPSGDLIFWGTPVPDRVVRPLTGTAIKTHRNPFNEGERNGTKEVDILS